MHVARGNHTDERAPFAQRERHVQLPTDIRPPERIVSGFVLAVLPVLNEQKRFVKEDLFRLELGYIVLFHTFAGIARIPVEADDPSEIDH